MATAPAVAKYQIRILSREPVELRDTEIHMNTWEWVLTRCYEQCKRTSYMVNGPNREVWFSIERWSHKRREFITIYQGKTKLKEGVKPI